MAIQPTIQPTMTILRTPLPNRRKRTLSAPSAGESVNKKLKNASADQIEGSPEGSPDTMTTRAEVRNTVTARRNLNKLSQDDVTKAKVKKNDITENSNSQSANQNTNNNNNRLEAKRALKIIRTENKQIKKALPEITKSGTP